MDNYNLTPLSKRQAITVTGGWVPVFWGTIRVAAGIIGLIDASNAIAEGVDEEASKILREKGY